MKYENIKNKLHLLIVSLLMLSFGISCGDPKEKEEETPITNGNGLQNETDDEADDETDDAAEAEEKERKEKAEEVKKLLNKGIKVLPSLKNPKSGNKYTSEEIEKLSKADLEKIINQEKERTPLEAGLKGYIKKGMDIKTVTNKNYNESQVDKIPFEELKRIMTKCDERGKLEKQIVGTLVNPKTNKKYEQKDLDGKSNVALKKIIEDASGNASGDKEKKEQLVNTILNNVNKNYQDEDSKFSKTDLEALKIPALENIISVNKKALEVIKLAKATKLDSQTDYEYKTLVEKTALELNNLIKKLGFINKILKNDYKDEEGDTYIGKETELDGLKNTELAEIEKRGKDVNKIFNKLFIVHTEVHTPKLKYKDEKALYTMKPEQRDFIIQREELLAKLALDKNFRRRSSGRTLGKSYDRISIINFLSSSKTKTDEPKEDCEILLTLSKYDASKGNLVGKFKKGADNFDSASVDKLLKDLGSADFAKAAKLLIERDELINKLDGAYAQAIATTNKFTIPDLKALCTEYEKPPKIESQVELLKLYKKRQDSIELIIGKIIKKNSNNETDFYTDTEIKALLVDTVTTIPKRILEVKNNIFFFEGIVERDRLIKEIVKAKLKDVADPNAPVDWAKGLLNKFVTNTHTDTLVHIEKEIDLLEIMVAAGENQDLYRLFIQNAATIVDKAVIDTAKYADRKTLIAQLNSTNVNLLFKSNIDGTGEHWLTKLSATAAVFHPSTSMTNYGNPGEVAVVFELLLTIQKQLFEIIFKRGAYEGSKSASFLAKITKDSYFESTNHYKGVKDADAAMEKFLNLQQTADKKTAMHLMIDYHVTGTPAKHVHEILTVLLQHGANPEIADNGANGTVTIYAATPGKKIEISGQEATHNP